MGGYFRDLDQNISGFLTPVIKWLFYICILVFLLMFLIPGLFANLIVEYMGASPGTTILRGRVWELVTYGFVHANFMHMFFNLLALYFFGTRLEQRWGTSTFVRFAMVATAGAVLTHLIAVTIRSVLGAGAAYLDTKIIGISGLVYACLLACAMYYPNDIVYVNLLFPIKLKYWAGILGVLTLMSSLSPHWGGGIAHLTHLGGLLFGFLFVKFPGAFDWIPLIRLKRKKPEYPDPRERWRNF